MKDLGQGFGCGIVPLKIVSSACRLKSDLEVMARSPGDSRVFHLLIALGSRCLPVQLCEAVPHCMRARVGVLLALCPAWLACILHLQSRKPLVTGKAYCVFL